MQGGGSRLSERRGEKEERGKGDGPCPPRTDIVFRAFVVQRALAVMMSRRLEALRDGRPEVRATALSRCIHLRSCFLFQSHLRAFGQQKGRVQLRDRTRPESFNGKLQICVARGQHGGEPRGFHLATAAFARLFEMPMVADFLEGSLAVHFLLQTAKRFFNGFALFQPDFGQLTHFLSGTFGASPPLIGGASPKVRRVRVAATR